MVIAHIPRVNIQGLSPGPEHCVVFLGKTLNNLHNASIHQRIINEYQHSKLLGKPNKLQGMSCDELASHPWEVETLLATSCYRHRDNLWQL